MKKYPIKYQITVLNLGPQKLTYSYQFKYELEAKIKSLLAQGREIQFNVTRFK